MLERRVDPRFARFGPRFAPSFGGFCFLFFPEEAGVGGVGHPWAPKSGWGEDLFQSISCDLGLKASLPLKALSLKANACDVVGFWFGKNT